MTDDFEASPGLVRAVTWALIAIAVAVGVAGVILVTVGTFVLVRWMTGT